MSNCRAKKVVGGFFVSKFPRCHHQETTIEIIQITSPKGGHPLNEHMCVKLLKYLQKHSYISSTYSNLNGALSLFLLYPAIRDFFSYLISWESVLSSSPSFLYLHEISWPPHLLKKLIHYSFIRKLFNLHKTQIPSCYYPP